MNSTYSNQYTKVISSKVLEDFGTVSSLISMRELLRKAAGDPSVWDTFAHIPGKVLNGDTGDVADDFYHRYKWRVLAKEDEEDQLKSMKTKLLDGVKNLRPGSMGRMWSRCCYVVQLCERVVFCKDYVDFADVCFREFGDRVKFWATFNEPWTYCSQGYGTGVHAPGRCSPYVSASCAGGDSSREPYLAAHHVILAHAAAVRLYRARYQAAQRGQVGITAVSHYRGAVQRSLDFMYGWFLDLSGACPPPNALRLSYDADIRDNTSGFRNGKPIGPQEFTAMFFNYPSGLRELLLYTKRRYNNPIIYVTENGIDEGNNKSLPIAEALRDGRRISFHSKHLQFVNHAIRNGARVKGYFTWTFMDCFEWGRDGYLDRFGLVYVDRLRRYRKQSSYWIADFLKRKYR
ncbi:LOW QUALITY PROTEIN: beta-glucosidase 29-like [Oryza brachyantha]|uniref:LOW QUALITY PROTEIN: beta-glucosidase 29-like n=1 Tax=Oryza brachyantha TaxID=4533 RepID=UPI001ADAA333|nr:LOW QUALITY PROTEIN: beta-glucosidase 29-like [Oryza brachyantha]